MALITIITMTEGCCTLTHEFSTQKEADAFIRGVEFATGVYKTGDCLATPGRERDKAGKRKAKAVEAPPPETASDETSGG
jgi:hypothetical protein